MRGLFKHVLQYVTHYVSFHDKEYSAYYVMYIFDDNDWLIMLDLFSINFGLSEFS